MASPTSYRQQIRTFVRMAKHQGWDVVMTSNGHWSFTNKRGEIVITGTTPSDHRSIKNLEARLKALGLNTDTDRRGKRKRPYTAPADPLVGYVSPLEQVSMTQPEEPEVQPELPIETPEVEPDPADVIDGEFEQENLAVLEAEDEAEFPRIVINDPHIKMRPGEARERRFQALCKRHPMEFFVLAKDAHTGFVDYRKNNRGDMWGAREWVWDVRPLRGKPGRVRVAASWQPK